MDTQRATARTANGRDLEAHERNKPPAQIAPMPDVMLHDHGSVIMVECVTDQAKTWVADNLSLEGWQWMGQAFACSPRYLDALIDGMDADGLRVSNRY